MESTATMPRRGSESSIKRRAYFFNAIDVPTKKQENFLQSLTKFYAKKLIACIILINNEAGQN